jgi:arylsulfatase A-like enzyme
MDQGVGMVVDALKETGKYENTLIFFLSDNGGVGTPPWNPSENWANNGPFREGKASFLEGGIHVPYLVHWADKLQPGLFDGLVSSLYIAATAVDLAGGDTSGEPLQGVNLIPYLSGNKKGSPHEALYWRERNSTSWAVRTPKAKFVKNAWNGGELCVFDMETDPYESRNIIEQAPEMRAELAKLWNDWNADNKANVLLHASDYQKWRLNAYEDLYKELKSKAEKVTPKTIQ